MSNYPEIDAVLSGESEGCIITGDCLEVMAGMADDCVDAVVTDPPYGIGKLTGGISKQRNRNNYASDFTDDRDYIVKTVVPAIKESIRVASRVVVTPGMFNVTVYPQYQSFGCYYQPAAVGLQSWGYCDAQPILYYGKSPIRNIGNKCSWQLTEPPSCKSHPCSKPIEAWTTLTNRSSLPNDIILDPFCGSGTTCVAAKKLGRRWIGIEIDEKYAEIARRRVQHTPSPLFTEENQAT